MIKLKDYQNFLNFVISKVEDLREEIIILKQGQQFSLNNILGNEITVEKQLHKKIDELTKNFLSDKIDNNIYIFQPYYREFWCLLHEIGHILNSELNEEYSYLYEELQNIKFNNSQEAYNYYRNIPSETAADNFAIEFTNKYFYEIIQHFNPNNTPDQAKQIIELMTF